MEKEQITLTDNHLSIDQFGDDFLVEILSRLPPKSLFKFKCVSKAWCSLISEYANRKTSPPSMSTIFYELCIADDETGLMEQREHRHASMSNKNAQYKKSSSSMDMSLCFLPCYPDFLIVDSCNGLLLCLSGRARGEIYYVCNPLMKRWVALPKPQNSKKSLVNGRISYDPKHQTHFKVIILSSTHTNRGDNSPVVVLQTFHSNTGKWVQSEIPITEKCKFSSLQGRSPVLLQQTLFSLEYPHHVMAIDFKEEKHQMIELPENVYPEGSLLQSGGHLYYINPFSPRFQIWMLEQNSRNVWILQHEIGVKEMVEKISQVGCPHFVHPNRSHIHPLAFGPGMEEVVFREHCKLLSYSFVSNKAEVIEGLRFDKYCSYRFCSCVYTPCLLSLENDRHQLEIVFER